MGRSNGHFFLCSTGIIVGLSCVFFFVEWRGLQPFSYQKNDASKAAANHQKKQKNKYEKICSALLLDDLSYDNNNNGGVAWIKSAGNVWSNNPKFQQRIYDASLLPKVYSKEPIFQQWIHQIQQFYTTERLQRSKAHPPRKASIRRLLEKLLLLMSQQQAEEDERHQPITILVMGGSVAAGNRCASNTLNLPLPPKNGPNYPDCNWATKLETLLNALMVTPPQEGGGATTATKKKKTKFFQVMNAAAHGTSSKVGTIQLQYGLFGNHTTSTADGSTAPATTTTPHIIIWAYSPNDSIEYGFPHSILYQDLQDWIQQANEIRQCDVDLPLIILLDDYYKQQDDFTSNLQMTGILYQMASWYQIMMVSPANLHRDYLHSHYNAHHYHHNKKNASSIPPMLPLMGSHFQVHMGLGFHTGVAWTLAYNLWSALVEEACSYHQDEAQYEEEEAEEENSNNNDSYSKKKKISSSSSSSSSLFEPRLHPKHIGRIRSNNWTAQAIVEEWEDNTLQTQEVCRGHKKKTVDDDFDDDDDAPICSYSWYVVKGSKFNSKFDVQRIIQPHLLTNQYWKADGFPIRNPRAGWYAQQDGATFTMQIIAASNSPIYYVTIISMKSYGPNFVGGKLRIELEVFNNSNNSNISNNMKEDPLAKDIHYIEGSHEIHTSVHFQHKLKVPGGGAKPGQVVRLHATFTGASTFKIAGMAFCRK